MQLAPSDLHFGLREAADARLATSTCPCSASAFREALGLEHWEGPHCAAAQRASPCDGGEEIENSSVPLLDTVLLQQGHGTELFADGRLVRVRCMVQDVRQAEYFSKRIVLHATHGSANGSDPVTLSGFWRDSIPAALAREYELERSQATAENTGERMLLHCIPIPGETDWVMDQRRATMTGNVLSKRGSSAVSLGCDKERNVSLDVNSRKKDTGEKGITFIVKIHDFRDVGFKLHDVLEVVGVLNLPTAADMGPDGNAMECNEDHVTVFPAALPEEGTFDDSQLPRLHALAWRPLGRPSLALRAPDCAAATVRNGTVELLQSVLGGDSIAAELLLLYLISRVQSRPELSHCIGKMSTNLFNVLPAQANALVACLEQLVPQAVRLDVAKTVLAKMRLIPKKNYVTNSLGYSVLQLAPGTHLVLDETKDSPSRAALPDNVNENLKALKTVTAKQKILVDFEFYKSEFPVDCPVLVISTPKSILPVDCRIKLTPESPAPPVLEPSTVQMDAMRAFINHCARQELVRIDEQVATAVQEHFVKSRQQGASIGGDDLQLWLTLSRLAAISFGENRLTSERWQWVLELDAARRGRL